MCHSATANCSRKNPSTGCTRPSRSRAFTDGRFFSRAGKCWADRARSTACSMSAASTRITTAGVNTAMPGGVTTTCCPISSGQKTSNAVPTTITGSAVRCRCRTGAMPIPCPRPSSRRQSKPAFPSTPISTARGRKARAISRPRRGAAGALPARIPIFARHGAAAISMSKRRRWRSASCSRDAARVRSNTGRTAACARRGRARKCWCRGARTIRRSSCSSRASDRPSC